ncbi:hypothetical protein KP509_34G059500 [Ceratopteris richardii]|uniref:Fe2OG dioxygenase domain-containing protein n=1 Tax=Ceratopteris richardii TaxID=49495 RepID=A0A8T2QK80_CERRI|nr:hypothetical protein KP509_34G059500 [Ceratopteris richardii]
MRPSRELCDDSMEFGKPRSSLPSPHLFVANCGPAVDLELPAIGQAFSAFGPLAQVQLADGTGCRVIVSFHNAVHAQAAKEALHGLPCPNLNNRVLYIQYSSVKKQSKVKEPPLVFEAASETGIPGLQLFKNFVNEDEEQELLAAVDKRPWQVLSKRRVQHYGYEFQYKIRNVDAMQNMGKLPEFTDCIVKKISSLPELLAAEEATLPLDQLTVNEYAPGVGLSPHIDTHSAFEGAIISLSLAGPCIMEFRKYKMDHDSIYSGKEEICEDDAQADATGCPDKHHRGGSQRHPVQCKPVFLPERSLLVLLGEARYGWHHYIPHHKVDYVNGQEVYRKQRRVSFTFRKVRHGPCKCRFASVCDSQRDS